jgi:hypothetical protein
MVRKTSVRTHQRRNKKTGKTSTVVKHPRALKNMTYSQLKAKGIKLSPRRDADGDGVINMKDCRPLNKKEQGIVHDLIKWKEKRAKEHDKKLEEKQDRLLKQLDNERTKLKKSQVVMKAVAQNKKLKAELRELKRANFRATKTGKVVAFVRDPKTGRKVSKTLKQFGKALDSLG